MVAGRIWDKGQIGDLVQYVRRLIEGNSNLNMSHLSSGI